MELNDELRSDLNNENISKEELSKLVYNDKIITMLQDALGKVVDGTTSFEEVLRVIEIEDAEDFFEKDTEEKVKEHQKEKDKEIQKELEEQEKKQEQAKNIHETNLEEVSLNIKKENTTPEIKATPRTIPTNIEEVPKDSIAKTTSNNKSINTLEKIETIDMGAFEAMESAGSTKLQCFRYAIMPQILPAYFSSALWSFEVNVRYAAILGYVGAGGIGLILNEKIGWREYDKVGMILLMLFITVIIIEYISQYIRERLS